MFKKTIPNITKHRICSRHRSWRAKTSEHEQDKEPTKINNYICWICPRQIENTSMFRKCTTQIEHQSICLGHGHWKANTSDMLNCPQPNSTQTQDKIEQRQVKIMTNIHLRAEARHSKARRAYTGLAKTGHDKTKQYERPTVSTTSARTCEWRYVLQLPSNALASHITCYNFEAAHHKST